MLRHVRSCFIELGIYDAYLAHASTKSVAQNRLL
jgi:hypothetical protein